MVSVAEPLDRFWRQYVQLEASPDFPRGEVLRQDDVQNELVARFASRDAFEYPPPVRYRARILKTLLSSIESSITDWDEHVSSGTSLPSRQMPSDELLREYRTI